LGNVAASLLKFLTEAAHVPVSKLGKIFKRSFFPEKSEIDVLDRSFPINVKPGAFVPTLGKLPMVFIVVPFNVIVAILILYFNEFNVYYRIQKYIILMNNLLCNFVNLYSALAQYLSIPLLS
jgi:hypothetical protein